MSALKHYVYCVYCVYCVYLDEKGRTDKSELVKWCQSVSEVTL